MDQELNYLGGEETGNASFAEGLKKLRKNSSRSGKLARIQALALALHAECKSVSDRYQLESEKSGRDWNRYMTVWQHHWTIPISWTWSGAELDCFGDGWALVSRDHGNALVV